MLRQTHLPVLIVATSIIALISTLEISIASFVASVILLVRCKKILFPKVFFTLLSFNMTSILLGNLVFSPQTLAASTSFLIFRVNLDGLELGAIGALKRASMLTLSHCWLCSLKSADDLLECLSVFRTKFTDKYFRVFLRELQETASDVRNLYFSVRLRTPKNKINTIRNRILHLRYILSGLSRRIFTVTKRLTILGESHYPVIKIKNTAAKSSLELKEMTVTLSETSTPILEGIELDISEPGLYLITGKVKTGKSTLLKAICGVIPKIEGEVSALESKFGDINTTNSHTQLNEIFGRISYITQHAGDHILGLTVNQEIGISECNQENTKLLASELGLADQWDMQSSQLSGGQQMKLALAKALSSNAELLLFDNPLSNLDRESRECFISLVNEYTKNDSKIIIIADEDPTPYVGYLKKAYTLKNATIAELTDIFFEPQIHTSKTKSAGQNRKFNEASPIVSIKELAFGYTQDRKILQNLTMEVRRGETLSIKGPNGSGKTTLGLLIAGLYEPCSGSIKRKDVSCNIVFQRPEEILIGSTVSDELLSTAKLKKYSDQKAEEHLESALKNLDMSGDQTTLDMHPLDARKLAIESAAIGTDLLILDEPTIGMDLENVQWLRNRILSLSSNGTSIILISHDPRVADIGDREIFLT